MIKKHGAAMLSASAVLGISAVLMLVFYQNERYLPFILAAISTFLYCAVGIILCAMSLASRRGGMQHAHPSASVPNTGEEPNSDIKNAADANTDTDTEGDSDTKSTITHRSQVRRTAKQAGKRIASAARKVGGIISDIAPALSAVLIFCSALVACLLFAIFYKRDTSLTALTYLSPVVYCLIFVVALSVEKWCHHEMRTADDDVFALSCLTTMRSALSCLRLDAALCTVAATVELLGLYQARRALAVCLCIIFIYKIIFLLLSLTVSLIRREFATAPDLSVPAPFAHGSHRDFGLLGYLEKNTGITMRSLWSLKLIKQMLPYTVIAAALLFWISTGLVQIESFEEGALYRFGKLQKETLAPGIHMTLPYPFDKVEIYNTQSIERTTVGYISSENTDNIWTAGHGKSEYKLLLGGGNELVSINLRIEYKIGDLYLYLTRGSTPDSILRAMAYEAITARTINTDLTSLLSTDRTEFASSFQADLEARLANYELGLSVVNVVLESIHPPIEIASVYQEIVSAGIKAEQYILDAEADAAVKIAEAEGERNTAIDSANAEKSTAVSTAKAGVAEFVASLDADRAYPDSYRYQKYLTAITGAYGNARLVIVGEGIDESRIYLGNLGQSTVSSR